MEKSPICDCDVIHPEIVDNVRKHMLSKDEFIKIANFYKVFSDSTRLRILWALEKSEMCICDLATLLNMTKSAISHQLKSLRLLNLVNFRKDGQIVFYFLTSDGVKDMITHIQKTQGGV